MLDNWLPFLIYGMLRARDPGLDDRVLVRLRDAPARADARARCPFESGVSTGPPQQQRFTVSFYLTAMLFIVFDIEIVFLYPLAVVLDAARAGSAFLEFLFFIAILVVAYVYIWRKGALEWQ